MLIGKAQTWTWSEIDAGHMVYILSPFSSIISPLVLETDGHVCDHSETFSPGQMNDETLGWGCSLAESRALRFMEGCSRDFWLAEPSEWMPFKTRPCRSPVHQGSVQANARKSFGGSAAHWLEAAIQSVL